VKQIVDRKRPVFHNRFHFYFLHQQPKSVDDTVFCRDDICTSSGYSVSTIYINLRQEKFLLICME
jgi:hypothetical protein